MELDFSTSSPQVLPELTAPSGELIPMMPGEAAKHADAGTCFLFGLQGDPA